MKAKELMIGDWVLYNGDSKPYPVQVTEITSLKQLGVYNDKELFWFIAGEKYFDPIPLTAEILKKNGFSEDIDGGFSNFTPYRIFLVCPESEIVFPYDGWVGLNIKYVHELQHALRLCGLNELADNLVL